MAENPWQGGKDPLDFPDLDELKKRWASWRGDSGRRPPGGGDSPRPPFPSRTLLLVVVGFVLLLIVFSVFYTVQPEEEAIVLRLGKYRGDEYVAGPGLHARIPLIDQVFVLPVQRQLKQEFGFRTEEVGVRSSFVSIDEEASMLTGDENVAIVEWVVQYRIDDAYKYLFKVRGIEETFRDLSEAVMRKVVGDRTVNEVVTVGRVEIENEAEVELQRLCDQYETGISVEEVLLQSNNPPDPVKPSFNEVNQAEQDRSKLVNEAQAQYNRVIPAAEGQALQTVEQAEGYAVDRVNRAQGEATRFAAVFAEYRRAPEVTRKRLYLETMNQILPRVGKKIVVDRDVEGLIPMLDLQNRSAGGAAVASGEGGG